MDKDWLNERVAKTAEGLNEPRYIADSVTSYCEHNGIGADELLAHVGLKGAVMAAFQELKWGYSQQSREACDESMRKSTFWERTTPPCGPFAPAYIQNYYFNECKNGRTRRQVDARERQQDMDIMVAAIERMLNQLQDDNRIDWTAIRRAVERTPTDG
jgi:hypothetical protein